MSPHNRSRYIAMLAIVLTTFFFTDIEAQASDTIWLKPYFKSVQQSSLGIQCVGWSRTGICAILQTLEAGERGGYYLRFLLLDSVDDATIFDKQAHTDDLGPNTPDPDDMPAAWSKTAIASEFSTECEANGIDESGGPELASFPLAYKGSQVSVAMAAEPGDERLSPSQKEDAAKGSKMLDLSILATRSGRGSKTLSKLKGVMASAYGVEGYYSSPYEPRILVVYSTTTSGFEGDKAMSVGFAGCSLEAGYK